MIKSVTNKSVVLFFNTDSTIVLQQKKKSSSSFSGAGHVSNHCWNEKISNLYSAHSRHEAGIWGKASGWRWFRDFDVKSVGMWAHGCTKVVFLAGIIYILKRFHSLHCFCLYLLIPPKFNLVILDSRFSFRTQTSKVQLVQVSRFKIPRFRGSRFGVNSIQVLNTSHIPDLQNNFEVSNLWKLWKYFNIMKTKRFFFSKSDAT